MNNRTLIILLFPIALFAAMWITSSLLTTQDYYRTIIIVSAVFMTLPLIIARHLAYDFKFLMLLCLGYAIAGKGFAYITPIEPIYIGEITLVLCMAGLLIRLSKGMKLFPSGLHITIFLFMAMTGISLLLRDYSEYKMLALRDASTAYYGLFFFAAFAMLESEVHQKAIRKVGYVMLVCWVVFACVNFGFQAAGLAGGLREALYKIHPIVAYFFVPHPDILFPLAATLAIICISKILRGKKLFYIIPLAVALLVLFQGKAAGLFAFTLTSCALVVFARRTEIGVFGVFSGLSAGLLLAVFYAAEFEVVIDYLDNVDAINTAQQGFSESGERNTSDWRLNWWGSIWKDTMEINPFFGTGMGSDIASSFRMSFYSYERAVQGLQQGGARYPHNILFSVIGRLGLVGLLVFCIYLLVVVKYLIDFCRIFLRRKDYLIGDLLFFALFCTGLANAFVQSTYEAPYAAIIHWVALAYIACRVYLYKRGMIQEDFRQPETVIDVSQEHRNVD